MSKKQRATVTETTIGGEPERRAKRRYPIDLPLEYKIVRNYLVMGNGTGRSLDLSSKGIAFQTASPLKLGKYLELSVSWPVLLNDVCPLKLVVSGKVVRSDGQCTALRLDRYEFRTQAKAAAARQSAGAFPLTAPQAQAVGMGYRSGQ